MDSTKTNEPLDLDAIEARANAATPGPWEAQGNHLVYGAGFAIAQAFGVFEILANERFIAAAREDVPALVAEVRRLREERDTLAREIAKITADRDFLKRREQSIIEATDPADGGQYRADIASAILRQRKDMDRAREEARLWKALADAYKEAIIARGRGDAEAHALATERARIALASLRASGIDPDAP